MAALGTACSSSPPETLAFTNDAPVVTEPSDGQFSSGVAELIDFHATWLCEVQRRTFATLELRDEARVEALADRGIDPKVYIDFLTGDLPRQDVRDAVLWEYQQHCLAE